MIRWQDTLIRALGVFVIGMGLALLGWLPFLQRTSKPTWQPRRGLAAGPCRSVQVAKTKA